MKTTERREINTERDRENAAMVGLPYDFLVNPLGAVRSTFEKAISSGSNPASFDGKDWGALDPFRHFLFDQDGLSKVQSLPYLTYICFVFRNFFSTYRKSVKEATKFFSSK